MGSMQGMTRGAHAGSARRPSGGVVRAAVCLLVAASVLSMVPGAAAAQSEGTASLSVVSVARETTDDADRVVIEFSEALQSGCNRGLTFSVDGGDPQSADAHGRQIDSGDASRMVFDVPSGTAADAAIKVFYDQPPPPDPGGQDCRYRAAADDTNRVGSFGWDLSTNQQTVTPMQIEAVLETFFSSTHTLRDIAQMYDMPFADALALLVAAGGLTDHFKVGQADEEFTRWGQPGTDNWVQIGGPGGGGSPLCGGAAQPRLQGRDFTRFFWACATPDGHSTQHGQWVPVKIAQPGVDYAREDQLQPGPAGGCHALMQYDPIRQTCIFSPPDQCTAHRPENCPNKEGS